MASRQDLFQGQRVEWFDLVFFMVNTGTIEEVSQRTDWVTVRLDEAYRLRPSAAEATEGATALATRTITHITLHTSELTPRD